MLLNRVKKELKNGKLLLVMCMIVLNMLIIYQDETLNLNVKIKKNTCLLKLKC